MVYVDALMHHGWRLRAGVLVRNCHMFCDGPLEELHAMALRIGMRQDWLQLGRSGVPHYDLTPPRREAAIAHGASPVDRRRAVALWRAIRYSTSPQA